MIITEIFYAVKCNRCGTVYDDSEHSFWSDEGISIENALESDWKDVNNKHYCPNCCEVDEETDEIKVYEDYPKHLKTLNTVIDKVLQGLSRQVFEHENTFVVKCRFYDTPILQSFQVEYIKNLLGEKFVSLDYVNGKHNNSECCIILNK